MSLIHYKEKIINNKDTMEVIPNIANKIAYPNINFISKIFINFNKIDYTKLQFTEESIYSSSRIKGSKKLIQVILKHTNNNSNIVITDGTANIGTDTINLTSVFNKINAIEISKVNYDALVNNIKVFNLEDKIKTYNGDTNKLIDVLKQDVIYIDAPWGGPKYKESDKIKLYLGSIEILDFYLKNKSKADIFIFKVPNNYDLDYLKLMINDNHSIYNYIKGNLIKYNLIVIESNTNKKIEKNNNI